MILRTIALAFLLLTAPAGAEVKGDCGTLILPKGADITGFNPEFATSLYEQQAASMMFEQLVWVNRYYAIDWPRSLASVITSPDQGLTYNVTLRSWHWSDGVPVSSADVAYTLQLIKAIGPNYPELGSGGMPGIIKTFTVIDPTHFQIVLTHKVNPLWFIYNGLSLLAPVPAHIWSHYTEDEIYQNQSEPAFFQVVDGPLRVQRLDFGQDIVFLPNPSYEGPKLHFNRLIYSFLNNDGANVQDMQAGVLDLSYLPDQLHMALNSMSGIYTLPFNGSSIGGILLNYHNPAVSFFHDLRVRQALQDALDQKTVIQLVYHGVGEEDYGPIPPDPPNFLSPSMRAGHYPVGYNPAKAKVLLAEAGFTPGRDGIMQKNGRRLSFTVAVSADSDEQLMEVVQAIERAAGIEIKLQYMDGNDLNNFLINPYSTAWQATVMGYPIGAFPSGENLFETGAYDNFGGYSDKTMDALINDSVAKPGADGLFAYEDYTAAQQPMIFLPNDSELLLVANRLRGIPDFENIFYQLSPDQLYCAAP